MEQEKVTRKLFSCAKIKTSQYKEEGNNKNNIEKIITIIFFIVVLLTIIFYRYKSILNIFFDKNGDFQWVGVTSIVAISTFGYSIYSTNKKNKYDIISKERIRWINDVKQQIAELLVLMNKYDNIVRKCSAEGRLQLSTNTPKQLKIRNKYHKEANLLMEDISFKINILLLSFADNPDNEQIISCIKDASNWVDSFCMYWNWCPNPFVDVTFLYDNVPIQNLMIVSRDYLNREWHKAQKGK